MHYATLFLLFLMGGIEAAPITDSIHLSHKISKKKVQAHVQYLSSESLEGRFTGSRGEHLATQYIADFFQQLGLDPAGDKGSFFQEFSFTAGVSLDQNSALSITNKQGLRKQLSLGDDWTPLTCSDNLAFNENTELVFAGYGIKGEGSNYNSYRGLDVKNKWVIVFRDIPLNVPTGQKRAFSQYSSPRYKTFIAKEQGAKGIILISGPNAKVKNELISLSFDNSVSSSGLIALSVRDKVIDALLKNSSHPLNTLQKIQSALDNGQLPPLPIITGFKLSGQIHFVKKIQQGRNVLAKLRINNSQGTSMVLVGAHVDHLGRSNPNGSQTLFNQNGTIHPGADDNASGVASVLEVAASLSTLKAQNKLQGTKDILFAAWSGEEIGILGSSYFIEHLRVHSPTDHKNVSTIRDIDAAINLDMVGHLREGLVLQGVGSSKEWAKLIEQLSFNRPFSIISQNDPYLPTDSTAFYLQGIPILNLFTGAHEQYHTPSDRHETLNYVGIKDISEFLVDLILAIEQKPSPMNYRQVQKNTMNTERELKVYLGTIPNYASPDVSGVAISGVTKNSPAEHAGMKKNDVIIELAGKSVHDLYEYTFILDSLTVGEPVKLVVLRKNEKITLSIIAQYRN